MICFGSLAPQTADSTIISTSGQKAEPVSRKSPRASSLPTCAHLKNFVHLWTKMCGRYCQGGESENNHVLRSKAVTRCYLAWGSSPPLSPLLTCSSLFLLPLHPGSVPQQALAFAVPSARNALFWLFLEPFPAHPSPQKCSCHRPLPLLPHWPIWTP